MQPEPQLEWRTRTLSPAPKLSDTIWRDWAEAPVGGNARGLMTGPVRELFQNKSELTQVELVLNQGDYSVAIQYRRKEG